MTFTSLTFIVFLPLVFGLYWTLRRRVWQNLLLLAASYFFYGWWDYRFCGLMLVSSLVDYAVGGMLGREERPAWRRALLATSVACNLGLLGVFKYFNFFTDNLNALASAFGWSLDRVTLNVILPVGISFYTFQTLSYTIDIYRRQIRPTRSLIDYLTFVSFFPQLVAGPIERAGRLLPQFARPRRFDRLQARDGCRLILWGFFKKIVLADRLAIIVDQAFGQPGSLSGPELGFATVCFAFQIYCDFSAYSDIAVGTAKLLNVELMRNFAYPYFSQSISEFWRRWHVSLSTWFRDYVFIPLGGSRTSAARRALNVVVTFLVSGLWHGAAWRFIAWGGLHGITTAGASLDGGGNANRHRDVPGGERFIPHPVTLLRMLITFAIVCAGWVFFRAEHTRDAMLILTKTVTEAFSPSGYLALFAQIDGVKLVRKTTVVLLIFVLVEWIQRGQTCPLNLDSWHVAPRWTVYSLLIWGSLDLMPPTGGQDFIYFDF